MIEESVKEAMKRGLLGFNIPAAGVGVLGSTVTDVLLNVDIGERGVTQRWLVTLGAFRYRQGALSSTSLSTVSSGPPAPDNQVETIAPNYKAILWWGSGGITEQATIDYPARGTTIAVTAQSVRLAIATSFGGNPALPKGNLSGFLNASDVSRDSVIQPPTFTTLQQALNNPGGIGSTFFDIPARAVGYRPLLPGSLGAFYSTGENLYQCDGLGTRIIVDDFNWAGTAAPVGAPQDHNPTNRLAWIPLHPNATEIEINTTSTTQQFVAIQFVLDIS